MLVLELELALEANGGPAKPALEMLPWKAEILQINLKYRL